MKIRNILKNLLDILIKYPLIYESCIYFVDFLFYLFRKPKFIKKSSLLEIDNNISSKINKLDNVLITMHWLKVGGAEKFAIDCISFYKNLGYCVHVFVDNTSENFYEEELKKLDNVYISDKDSISIHALHEKYSYKIIHNHHSDLFYEFVNIHRLKITIIDTLHILELPRNHFGYPIKSINSSSYITYHHVISNKLKYFLILQSINESKIIKGHLFFDNIKEESIFFKYPQKENLLRIGFLGRFDRQKRPILFCLYMNYLSKFLNKYKVQLEVHILGTGSYESYIKNFSFSSIISKVSFYDGNFNKVDFFNNIDIMLLTSENEGVTLAAMESFKNNTLVISTNVGAQDELIHNNFLISPNPIKGYFDLIKIIKNVILKTEKHKTDIRNQKNLILDFQSHDNAFDAIKKTIQ